jgi:hypothetical protein
MNAIRIRKENQVYSAEEKRALSLLNFEEKVLQQGVPQIPLEFVCVFLQEAKEKKLMSDFRKFLKDKDEP